MHDKRRKNYAERSARQKKLIYIRAKNDIRRAENFFGGLFFSGDYFHGKNGWVDVRFIGKDRKVYFAALQTAAYAYKEAVNDAASDAAEAIVPYPLGRMSFGPIDPKTGLGAVHIRPEGALEAFGGLTRMEWEAAEAIRIADSGAVQVFENVSLHHDYSRSIGVHATLDVPFLTVKAVDAFVREFLASGQKAFRKETPITYKHADIAHWGLESNALVDPFEYPPNEGEADAS